MRVAVKTEFSQEELIDFLVCRGFQKAESDPNMLTRGLIQAQLSPEALQGSVEIPGVGLFSFERTPASLDASLHKLQLVYEAYERALMEARLSLSFPNWRESSRKDFSDSLWLREPSKPGLADIAKAYGLYETMLETANKYWKLYQAASKDVPLKPSKFKYPIF